MRLQKEWNVHTSIGAGQVHRQKWTTDTMLTCNGKLDKMVSMNTVLPFAGLYTELANWQSIKLFFCVWVKAGAVSRIPLHYLTHGVKMLYICWLGVVEWFLRAKLH